MSYQLQQLFKEHRIPRVFTREHDVIVLATPFSLTEKLAEWTEVHRERLREAIVRRFVRSAIAFERKEFAHALEKGCTPELGYRLTVATEAVPAADTGGQAILLTCAPNAHLALVNFLERKAHFTAETVGRVVQRATQSPLH